MSANPWAESIRGLVLDIDDTLVDTRAAMHRAGAIGAAAAADPQSVQGPQAPTPEHHAVSDRFYQDPGGFFDAYTRGELTFPQMRRLRWQEAATGSGLLLDDDAFTRFESAYLAAFASSQTLFDDVPVVLARAAQADVAICLLTNSGDRQTDIKLTALGLSGAYPVVTTDTLGVGKPDPAVFSAASRCVGVDPEAILSVGDTLHTDIVGARAAGMRAAWLQRPGRPEPRNAGWGTPVSDADVIIVPDLRVVADML